jgi:hypothetical protein
MASYQVLNCVVLVRLVGTLSSTCSTCDLYISLGISRVYVGQDRLRGNVRVPEGGLIQQTANCSVSMLAFGYHLLGTLEVCCSKLFQCLGGHLQVLSWLRSHFQ